MSSSAAPTEVRTEPFPSLADLDEKVRKPLNDAYDEFGGLTMLVENAVGRMPDARWVGRFEEPPTIENIGTVTIICDQVAMLLKMFQEELADLRASTTALDGLRFAGAVSHDA